MRAKRAEPAESAPPVPLGMDLASAATAGEAYDRVARAFDEGRLTPAQARVAVELLKVRSTVVAAEEFRRRLELTEAAAREAQRRAVLPARSVVVEADAVPEGARK